MSENSFEGLCGLFIGEAGSIHACFSEEDGSRREEALGSMQPFVWLHKSLPTPEGAQGTELKGPGPLGQIVRFEDLAAYDAFLKLRLAPNEYVKDLANQWLLQHGARYFEGMRYRDLRRCQCDIETMSSVPGSFCSATRKADRILAIGLRVNGEDHFIELAEDSDEAEKALLEAFNVKLRELDPDVIEGHNFFNFDLCYIRDRAKRLQVPCAWGRFGMDAEFRKSRMKVAERWVDFTRCEIPGRTVFDTYLMVQLYDLTKREMPSYGLKAVAKHLGITNAKDGRTYLDAEGIAQSFWEDRETFRAYLSDDLRETEGLASLLLPTYFAQVGNFPMGLQEACLRGNGMKLDLLFLEQYYKAKEALPEPSRVGQFEGGFTKSFETGVFKKVLSYDVASLYPSLMLMIGRNPKNDSLGCFIALLAKLRDYRLKYKRLAAETQDEGLRLEYDARQASFKILINSFYGYLGFDVGRFSDDGLAAEVTLKGRELLIGLIDRFEKEGKRVLEADTDGIYVQSEEYYETPQILLEKVTKDLPEGIELEFAGRYPAMLAYKAKNYALLKEDGSILIKGSALRSRGIEPFLRELTDGLIAFLLGASQIDPRDAAQAMISAIDTGSFPIEKLAKSEQLNQSPAAYERAVSDGKKPRRAALEVALTMNPKPAMGDRVRYYVCEGEKKRMPVWQRAVALANYDAQDRPYDAGEYIKKVKDWLKRYEDLLEG